MNSLVGSTGFATWMAYNNPNYNVQLIGSLARLEVVAPSQPPARNLAAAIGLLFFVSRPRRGTVAGQMSTGTDFDVAQSRRPICH